MAQLFPKHLMEKLPTDFPTKETHFDQEIFILTSQNHPNNRLFIQCGAYIMKRLNFSFLILSALSLTELKAETFLTNPNFSLGKNEWSSGWPSEVVRYTEEDQGVTIRDQYLALQHNNGVNWNPLVTGRATNFYEGTPLYFYIEASHSEQCEEVELMVRIVDTGNGRGGILDEKTVILNDHTRWHAIRSDYVVYTPYDTDRISLQLWYWPKNCENGTFDVNFAQIGTDVTELSLLVRGRRSRN
ncbi:MAG: hypothetical protein ACOH5I_25565 [Oligoflexus sp.]